MMLTLLVARIAGQVPGLRGGVYIHDEMPGTDVDYEAA
jgi:hypothetical protein